MCFTEEGKLYRLGIVLVKYCLNFHLHEDECFNEYELQPDNREKDMLLFLFCRDLPYAEI